jgi:hypothetical protein
MLRRLLSSCIVPTKRTIPLCRSVYSTLSSSQCINASTSNAIVLYGSWTPKEDEILTRLVDCHGTDWEKIVAEIPYRTKTQCMARWQILCRQRTAQLPTDRSSDTVHPSTLIENNAVSSSDELNIERELVKVKSTTKKSHPWTEEEKEALRLAVKCYGPKWNNVAKRVPGRTAAECLLYWRYAINPEIKHGAWSEEEDQLLREAVEKYGTEDWAKISMAVPGRTRIQCRKRWVEYLCSRKKRVRWTKEETDKLEKLVAIYHHSWVKIAEFLPGRTPIQCRDRWRSCQIPTLRRGKWTPEEDELLKKAVLRYGRSWTKVASMVPGRTPNQCSIRWDVSVCPDVAHTRWTPEEDEKLLAAVQGVALDPKDYNFDWKAAALAVGTRNARQCQRRYQQMERTGRTGVYRSQRRTKDEKLIPTDDTSSLANRLYQVYLSEQYGDGELDLISKGNLFLDEQDETHQTDASDDDDDDAGWVWFIENEINT